MTSISAFFLGKASKALKNKALPALPQSYQQSYPQKPGMSQKYVFNQALTAHFNN
jgi:hypothetical protein